MFPNNEEELVGAAAEHIEEASIADGRNEPRKPAPTGLEGVPEIDPNSPVAAAAEHIEEASIADGLRER